MVGKRSKVDWDWLRDQLITLEHGPFYRKGGQWACECWPMDRVKKIYRLSQRAKGRL